MPRMTKEDIIQLGLLSRISLTPTEIEILQAEIDSIVAYVSTVRDIAALDETGPSVGVRYNVLRTDEVTTTPGEHTETLLDAMPQREGQFMAVKKFSINHKRYDFT